MGVQRRYNILSQERVDLPGFKGIESAVSSDFDTMIQTALTGDSQPYVMRGFNISMAGAIGGAASALQLLVAGGALLHNTASEAGTSYMVPTGTPAEQLNSATNTIVTGAFTPSSINYVGLDYERFRDDSTSVQSYFWDPSSNSETTKNVPQAIILRYRIVISTTTPPANILPIAIVATNSGNNVTDITDCRNIFGRLGRGGFTPNPFYTYTWPQGQNENPSSSSVAGGPDPFSGGDKAIGNVKEALDALMTEIKGIKGTTYWYSASNSGSLESIRQDLGNTVITGRGTITHSATTAGLLNWSDDINIQVIGSDLSYTLAANPSSTDITLTDEKTAYITLVRDADIAPNLLFTNGSPTVGSVGSVPWTASIQAGDFIKVASDTSAGYYKIQSVNTASSVTLAKNYAGSTTTAVGVKAKYAFGTYQTSPSPSTSRHIFIANRNAVPQGQNVFWLYLRSDNSGSMPRIYVRFLGIEIEQGETEDISDTVSKQLLQYIGAPLESSFAPMYVSALNPGSIAEITDLSFGPASGITSNQYFLINSSGNAHQYYVWFNKDGTGVDPTPPYVYNGQVVAITSAMTAAQVAAAVAAVLNPLDAFTAIQRSTPNTNVVRVTNTSAGATIDASNFNVGGLTVTIVQQGTGVGNYFLEDGDSLTLAIKKLDQGFGQFAQTLMDPAYDEPVDIAAPVTIGTILTLPLNTRKSNIQQTYIVGKGTLLLFLNGQYQRLGVDFLEVGAAGTISQTIQINRALVSGDTLEYRGSLGGGGVGGGAAGPAGPTGPAGAAGANAITGPSAISTKTSSYTVTLSDTVLLANTTGGAITFTLPTAASATGRTFWFKKISSDGFAMSVKGAGSELVDFSNTISTTVQGESFTVISDSTQYWVI